MPYIARKQRERTEEADQLRGLTQSHFVCALQTHCASVVEQTDHERAPSPKQDKHWPVADLQSRTSGAHQRGWSRPPRLEREGA